MVHVIGLKSRDGLSESIFREENREAEWYREKLSPQQCKLCILTSFLARLLVEARVFLLKLLSKQE